MKTPKKHEPIGCGMTDEEIIERIAHRYYAKKWEKLSHVQKASAISYARRDINTIRAAGFVVIAADELEQLRHADEEPDYYDECQTAEEELVAAETKIQQLESELAELRTSQIPPGWVCVDLEAKINSQVVDAADRIVIIHNEYGENLYVENTEEVIAAALRALRDQQTHRGDQ